MVMSCSWYDVELTSCVTFVLLVTALVHISKSRERVTMPPHLTSVYGHLRSVVPDQPAHSRYIVRICIVTNVARDRKMVTNASDGIVLSSLLCCIF